VTLSHHNPVPLPVVNTSALEKYPRAVCMQTALTHHDHHILIIWVGSCQSQASAVAQQAAGTPVKQMTSRRRRW
jgi:hypothetical protein